VLGFAFGSLIVVLMCVPLSFALQYDHAHITKLFDRMYKGITSQLDNVVLNGDISQRYLGNLNLSFAFVEVTIL